jgi:hypothetical protein
VDRDEALENTERRVDSAELELEVHERLECGEPKLLETLDLGCTDGADLEPIQGCLGRPVQDGPQAVGRGVVRLVVGVSNGGLEPIHIQRADRNAEDVARSLGPDRLRAQELAELREITLERGLRGRRRILAPNELDEPIGRDDAVPLDEEDRKDSSLARPADVERPAVEANLERAEQCVLDHRCEPKGWPERPLANR